MTGGRGEGGKHCGVGWRRWGSRLSSRFVPPAGGTCTCPRTRPPWSFGAGSWTTTSTPRFGATRWSRTIGSRSTRRTARTRARTYIGENIYPQYPTIPPNRYWRTRELTSAEGRQGTSGPIAAQGGRGGEGNPRGTPEGKPSCGDLLVDFGPRSRRQSSAHMMVSNTVLIWFSS